MLLPRRRRILAAACTIAVGWASAACGGGDEAGACGPLVREPLDPSYLVHVLDAEAADQYTSDPPTSGPHQAGPPMEGVLDEPLSRPVQVGILERGDVLVQHDPDLDPDETTRLARLAGPGVVVAPNPDLPDRIVLTAWTHKRVCDAVDLDAIGDFIDARVGKGPEG